MFFLRFFECVASPGQHLTEFLRVVALAFALAVSLIVSLSNGPALGTWRNQKHFFTVTQSMSL